jgi:hypothetical protein
MVKIMFMLLNARSHSAVEIIIIFAAAINGFSSSGYMSSPFIIFM